MIKELLFVVNFFKKNKEKLITFIVCGTIFVAALSVVALLSGAIMRLFGFRYQSIGSIILFFVIATIVSYPINLIAGGLPKAFYKLERISKNNAIFLYLMLDTIATCIGLMIVDYCMSTISASDLSILVISFILALPGIEDLKKI